MFENEIKRYKTLNELAKQNGILIFGGTDDKKIPLCELKQAFELNPDLYNRSVDNLSVVNAPEVYAACAAELKPETVILHIGKADLKLCEENAPEFEKKYCELIRYIRANNTKCDVVIISFKNPKATADIAKLNKHLKYIANSEQCEYYDTSVNRTWNPIQSKDVISFVYSIGFVQPLKTKRPISDLVRILFCCEA